ncbi:MAG TPA: tetratricopeptide repeat protein [Geothrix sp.]|nr:tetratricopeptide repeat protein [Geothrix sp.]
MTLPLFGSATVAFLLAQTPPPQVLNQAPLGRLPPGGDALVQAKDWSGLADWFERLSPATRGTYYLLWLECLNKSQRWDRLLEVCEALQPQLEAKTGPKLGLHRVLQAQALSKLGRHADAARCLAEMGRLGDSATFFVDACNEARVAGDWNQLLTYAEEIHQKFPQENACLAWQGEALVQLYRLAEAEPFLRAAVEKDPTNVYAWNNLGHCLNERKAWAEACAAFDKALALNPKLLEGLFNRGRAHFELKQYKESRDDFRAALDLQPDNQVIAENLKQAERYAALPPTPAPAPKPSKAAKKH